MLNNHKHNLSCNLSEQLISFVYGEISPAEKSHFEAHLQNCTACSAEIADFGFLRSSIQEWRAEDFDRLSTPVIAVPWAKQPSAGWLDSIRAYFSLSAIGVTAGLAAVVFLTGLIWFLAADTKNNVEIAGNRTENLKETLSTPVPSTNKDEMGVSAAAVQSDSDEPKPVSRSQSQNLAAGDKEVATRSVQVNSRSRVPVKIKNMAAPAEKTNKTSSKTPKKDAIPTLSYDEYQDKSLRLSDILEEVSLRQF